MTVRPWFPRRVLVTGAQGFVGRHLVAHWLSRDSDVTILGVGRSPGTADSFTHFLGESRNVRAALPRQLQHVLGNDRYRYESVDLRSAVRVASLVQRFRPDLVVHLAAALHDETLDRLVSSNISATAGLMEGIGACAPPLPRVVVASTGGVYGPVRRSALPLRETTPCAPEDLYSATKLASEQLARILARRRGVPLLIGRVFNVVGPGQDEQHFCGSVCGQLARTPAHEPAVLRVGPLEATRDFIDVRDVARAFEIIARAGAVDTAYNIASGVETSMHQVLRTIVSVFARGRTVRIEQHSGRPRGVARHYADIGRLRRLGYEPTLSLTRSLVDTLAYYELSGVAPPGLVAAAPCNDVAQAAGNPVLSA